MIMATCFRVSVRPWLRLAMLTALSMAVVTAMSFRPATAAAAGTTGEPPVFLVATDRLAGTPYEGTVLVVVALPQGGHMGVVLNRPTETMLTHLFPEQASTRQVREPVFAGGPMMQGTIYAIVRKPLAVDATVIPLTDELVAVMDEASVDRIIDSSPNEARYFVGLQLWPPFALDLELGQGLWRRLALGPEDAVPAGEAEAVPGTCRRTEA